MKLRRIGDATPRMTVSSELLVSEVDPAQSINDDPRRVSNVRDLAFRNLDGTLLRRYTEAGTTGAGAMRWLEDEMWAGRTLLGTASPSQGKRFVATDHLGSPRLICDRCAKETALHAYYPFGMEATDPRQDAEPTRFTGQETDRNSASGQTDDLVYMHARFYDPIIARFLSPDVLPGNGHAPQSFNLFAYVRGNPANDWDPFGMYITQDPTNPFHFHDSLDVIGIDPWRVAAWGWQSRDNFAFGTPSSGGEGGGVPGPYADPYREMLRVAGGGTPYTDEPTFEDYMGWYLESYSQYILEHGTSAGGITIAVIPRYLSGRFGLSLAAGSLTSAIRFGSGISSTAGDSLFFGSGLTFGSVGAFHSRASLTLVSRSEITVA